MTIRGIQENLNKRDTILKKKINSPIYSSRNGPCLPYDYRFDCIHNGETRNRLSLIRASTGSARCSSAATSNASPSL